jgi:hypothetical protein
MLDRIITFQHFSVLSYRAEQEHCISVKFLKCNGHILSPRENLHRCYSEDGNVII